MLLSFKTQFEKPICNGSKTHTIRRLRKRPFQVGDKLQFFVNPRTKAMRKICPDKVCSAVQSIQIRQPAGEAFSDQSTVVIDGQAQNIFEVKSLAQNDGFENVQQFLDFFRDKEGNINVEGQLIHWQD